MLSNWTWWPRYLQPQKSWLGFEGSLTLVTKNRATSPLVNPYYSGPQPGLSLLLHGSHFRSWKWRRYLVLDWLMAPRTENCRPCSTTLYCHPTDKEKTAYCEGSPHEPCMDFIYPRSPHNWDHCWIHPVLGSSLWVSATARCGKFTHLEIIYRWTIFSQIELWQPLPECNSVQAMWEDLEILGATQVSAIPMVGFTQALLDLGPSCTMWTVPFGEMPALWSGGWKHWSSSSFMCILKTILVSCLATGWPPFACTTTNIPTIWWLVGESEHGNFWFDSKRVELDNNLEGMDNLESSQPLCLWWC
jgi:hypothetical protein